MLNCSICLQPLKDGICSDMCEEINGLRAECARLWLAVKAHRDNHVDPEGAYDRDKQLWAVLG